METFILLLLFSTLIFAAFFALLIWGVKSGQLDDLQTPAERILWDDPHPQEAPSPKKSNERNF